MHKMMTKQLPYFLAISALAVSQKLPAHTRTQSTISQKVSTLCEANERALFSCKIGSKTLSICASLVLTDATGSLRYRFGRTQKELDLVFPTANSHPVNHFKFFSDGGAKWSSEVLSFSIENTSYLVNVQRASFSENSSGVAVIKDKRRIANFVCNTERPHPDDLFALKNINLQPIDFDSLIPLWNSP
jgi:hypothetical protein